jgi:hypothetical protein
MAVMLHAKHSSAPCPAIIPCSPALPPRPCPLLPALPCPACSGRDLVNMAKKRPNVIPIIEDARHPQKYRMLVPMVDVVFADVAQPDQVCSREAGTPWGGVQTGRVLNPAPPPAWLCPACQALSPNLLSSDAHPPVSPATCRAPPHRRVSWASTPSTS